MKKGLIVLIVLGVLAFMAYQWGVGFNNTAVEYEANAKTAWSNVESSYQRRNDLIGNLVKTVQGAADFERGTLKDVIEARAKATSTKIDANNLTSENIAAFQQAQSGLTGALSKLMVVVERYPELKANQNFLELQAQLEGVLMNKSTFTIYIPLNFLANFSQVCSALKKWPVIKQTQVQKTYPM